jgi:serine/threonine protein kinase
MFSRLYLEFYFSAGTGFWILWRQSREGNSSGLPSGLSPTEVINLMLPVARALNYLHGKEVAHRDLKPQNIMCTLKCNNFNDPELLNEVTVKLIDFGDARKLKKLGAPGDTIGKATIGKAGTNGYMAPEVHDLAKSKGDMKCCDATDLLKAADIFSFGMVLGEVLTNRPPLEALGSGQPSIFWNKQKEGSDQLHMFWKNLKEGERPDIPDHFPLSFITRSCWDANPRHRPQAEDICRMLSHAKLVLSGNVFSPDELTKVFSFLDHDGMTKACNRDDMRSLFVRGFSGGLGAE